MPKEKIQPNKPEARDLSMAKRVLGRAKEIPMTVEEKDEVMKLIDEAKALESEGNLGKAALAYRQVADKMKAIKQKLEMNKFSGLKLKEFWDWNVDEKLLIDLLAFEKVHGSHVVKDIMFTKDGENSFVAVEPKDLIGSPDWEIVKDNSLATGSKIVIQKYSPLFGFTISDDGQHLAVVTRVQKDDDEYYQVETEKGVLENNTFSNVPNLKFSPDGQRFVEIIPDEISTPKNPYIYIHENGEFQFLSEFEKNLGYSHIQDFTFSPDSEKMAVIFHVFDKDGEVNESLVLDGDKRWAKLPATLKSPAYSLDGTKLAVVDGEGQIMVNEKYIDMVWGKCKGQPVFSPDSNKIAYAASIQISPGERALSMAENNKIIWSGAVFSDITDITYSDNGKNIAAVVKLEKGGPLTILVNGRIIDNNSYEKCEHLTFSPDNKKIMFVALKDGKYRRIVRDLSEFDEVI